MNRPRSPERNTLWKRLAATTAVLTLTITGCAAITSGGGDTEGEEHTLEEGFHVGLLLPDLYMERYEAFDRPFFESARRFPQL